MTTWQQIYLILDGGKPGDPQSRFFDIGEPLPGSVAPGDQLAQMLKRFGFLKRDPDLPERTQGYWYNFKWQWRFWRGPYRDAIAKQYPDWDWDPPSWWDTATDRWP